MPFSERVPLFRGVVRRKGGKYWDASADKGKGKWSAASSATSYSWIIWLKGQSEPSQIARIPPCRLKLERVGDYEPLKADL